jgi:hypothetical protein
VMISSRYAISQEPATSGTQDLKHVLATMPEGSGRIRLAAMSIDRYVAPPSFI